MDTNVNLKAIKRRFEILGNSEGLEQALQTAVRVAPTDLTVLITGESGSGKEVFSKVIHSLSLRKHNPFIAINCGAIPEGTINSELFGHEKGSFTGAIGERKGYFETVNGGTIFLDEIGEMPLDTQAFLLRVLETGEFIRVGSSKSHKTDVRVIAATNINLEDLIRKGKFREDLYFRLNTVPIRVPPLRDRTEDIHILFRKFALDFAERYATTSITLDPQSWNLLERYNWPGNIRELRNVTEQLSVMADHRELSVEDVLKIAPQLSKRNLPSIVPATQDDVPMSDRDLLYKFLFEIRSDVNDLKSLVFELISSNQLTVRDINSLRQLRGSEQILPTSEELHNEKYFPAAVYPDNSHPVIIQHDDSHFYEPLDEVVDSLSIEVMEKQLIEKALKKHNGKRKEAAKELGLSERTLYRKIKQYDLTHIG